MASRQTDPTCGPDHSSTPKSTPPQDRIDLSSAGAAKLLNFGPDRRAWPALDLADLRADFLRFADLGADLRLTIKAQETSCIQVDEWHVDSPIMTRTNSEPTPTSPPSGYRQESRCQPTLHAEPRWGCAAWFPSVAATRFRPSVTTALPDIVASPRQLSAVFLVEGGPLAASLIGNWRAAGHRVAAVVLPRRRRRHYRFRMIAAAALAGVPLTTIALPVDWTSVAAMIEPLAADLLVCYAFPLLVPPEILALFPKGGVNFHPALLPQYRGPNPVRCMVADSTWQAHGGMTLHTMAGRYDEGDILADVAFSRTAWLSAAHLRAAAAAVMAEMVVEAIPLYCAGRLRPRPQPTGDFAYARYVPRVVTVRPDWTADHLAAAGAWLHKRSWTVRRNRRTPGEDRPGIAPRWTARRPAAGCSPSIG